MRDDGGSTFAAIMVGFAAMADSVSVVSESVSNDAGSGSTGQLATVLSKQANRFVSVHGSMLACGIKGQLQPAKVAASAPMRSVLMQSP